MTQSVEAWYAKGQTAAIDNLNIFYHRAGTGPYLLCIHGFPSSSWDFAAIWPSLVTRFDVIAHDLVGLGRSAKPKRPLTVRLQADVIEELAWQQGIQEAHILAHDLGDTIAQELLARQFEAKSKVNWRSCIFLNGGIFPETHRPLLLQKLLLSPLGPLVAQLTSRASFAKNMRRIFSKAHPPGEEFLEGTWKLLNENQGISMIPRLIRYMEERVASRERWVTPLVNQVVPIRLINGTQDPVSGRHAAERFTEVIPNADVVFLDDAGHYPHVETPAQVVAAIFAFHEEIGRSTSG